MSTYAFAVKVRKTAPSVWRWDCPACGSWGASSSVRQALRRVYRWAAHHAATCEAACHSCKADGRVSRDCPVCLGRGWIAEREGLE